MNLSSPTLTVPLYCRPLRISPVAFVMTPLLGLWTSHLITWFYCRGSRPDEAPGSDGVLGICCLLGCFWRDDNDIDFD